MSNLIALCAPLIAVVEPSAVPLPHAKRQRPRASDGAPCQALGVIAGAADGGV